LEEGDQSLRKHRTIVWEVELLGERNFASVGENDRGGIREKKKRRSRTKNRGKDTPQDRPKRRKLEEKGLRQ